MHPPSLQLAVALPPPSRAHRVGMEGRHSVDQPHVEARPAGLRSARLRPAELRMPQLRRPELQRQLSRRDGITSVFHGHKATPRPAAPHPLAARAALAAASPHSYYRSPRPGLSISQPKEGRKELAPREIKFRCRRLDTTIRERAGSSQVPREAQESERYPGLFFFVSFFYSLLFLRDVVAKSLAPWRRESRQESPMVQTERGSPTISLGF